MAKTQPTPYSLVDARSAPGIGVVLLKDQTTGKHVIAWHTNTEKGSKEASGELAAKLLFVDTCRRQGV
jgi:hypothetical protein